MSMRKMGCVCIRLGNVQALSERSWCFEHPRALQCTVWLDMVCNVSGRL